MFGNLSYIDGQFHASYKTNIKVGAARQTSNKIER